MASEEQRGPPGPAPGLGPPPSPPEAGAPAAEPPLTLARPVSPRDPDFRLLLEESAFQALAQELLLKRPRASQDALPPGEGEGRRRLPFPKKLWAIVNSARFASVWWASDGTCIGINEKLFQKEVLERDGPDKVFKTDSMKSFVRQLSLYGFSRLRRNAHTSICPTNYFTGGAPVHIQSKLQFYKSPFFKRDCPHLLQRMKRRVSVKSTRTQMESEPDAPGAPPPATPPPSLPPEGVLRSASDQREPASSPARDGPATQVGSRSAPPVILGAAARTAAAEPHAAAGRPADGQPQGAQAPAPLVAVGAEPAAFPGACVTPPPAQICPHGPVLGPAPGPPVLLPRPPVLLPGPPVLLPWPPVLLPGPPVLLPGPPGPLPVARLLPLYRPWVPGMAAGPVSPVTPIAHPRSPFHCCPHCRCFPEYLPLAAGPPGFPHYAHHRS